MASSAASLALTSTPLRPPPPPPLPRPPPAASSSSGTPRMCSSDVHTVGSSGGLSSGGFGLCWCGGPRCAVLSCPAPSFPSERNRWSGVSSDIVSVAVSRPTPRGFAHSSHSTSNKLNPSGQRPGRGEHSWHRRPSNQSHNHAPTPTVFDLMHVIPSSNSQASRSPVI
jgi:hypothetical protein